MNSASVIADATEALAAQVAALVADLIPGTRVTILNPASEALRTGEPTVNLYLLRARQSPNHFAPPRDLADGRSQPHPRVDLDYIFTFFGNDSKLEPQRLLEAVAAGLDATPMQASGLRLSALDLPLDELARLWSAFLVPYQLSQLYTLGPIAFETPLPPMRGN